jgi:hypothetical protein
MTANEDEIQWLRAEVARLQAAQADRSDRSKRDEKSGRAGRAGRWVGAVALLLVALLLGVASIAAVFVRNQLLDTDRYVATVAPLARDPVVQDAVANRLTNEIITRVDLAAIAEQASVWLTAQGAPPAVNALVEPAVNGVESLVRTQVRRLVGTDQFAAAWDSANRVAHDALVTVLTGGSSGAVSSSDTAITVDLGVFLDTVKQRLVGAGFGLVERIPDVSIPFTVYSSPDLPELRTYVKWLDSAATWLPWVALALIAAAVLVAPNRRRGLLMAGLFVAIGLLLTRGGIAVARDYYLDRLPEAVQSREAVVQVLDTVTRRVREAVTVLIVVGFLVALAAWLAGPGRVPVALRRLVVKGLDAAAAGLSRVGLPLGRGHDIALRYRRVAELAVVFLAVLILVLNPSVAAAFWLAAGVLLALVLVEILARLPRRPTAAPAS